MRRHGSQARESAAPRLSESERRLYMQARELLAREIGSARGLEQVEADAWIEEQVAPTSEDEFLGTPDPHPSHLPHSATSGLASLVE
jgi:hypothetical protein